MLSDLAIASQILVVAHGALAFSFTLVAIGSVAWFRRTRGEAPRTHSSLAEPPNVVLLRPAEAADAHSLARWETDHDAYRGRLVRILCVPKEDVVDASTKFVVHVAKSDLAPDAPTNRKAVHLEAGLRHARSAGWVDARTIVIHADADVTLRPGCLDALVGAIERDSLVGLSFAAPAPPVGSNFASLLAAAILSASPHAFAVLFALSRVTRSPPAIAGKLVAMPIRALDAIGGYGRITGTIAEDIELVDAVHRAGFRIALAPHCVEAWNHARSLRELLAQLTRWFRVISSHRPGVLIAYPLFVAPLAVSLALGALAFTVAGAARSAPTHGSFAVFLPFAALFTARVLLAVVLAVTHYGGAARRALLWAPLAFVAGDLAVMVGVVGALRRAPIQWAGRLYQVERGGRIKACTVESA